MVEGTDHDAVVEILLDDQLTLTGITTNVKYSMGELMEKAALNTILGMGTVFVVLILISLIISCFVVIPKIQDAFTGKKKETAEPVSVPAAPAPAAAAAVEDCSKRRSCIHGRFCSKKHQTRQYQQMES